MPSVTLTFSSAHAGRIRAALDETLELEEPATVEDFKDYIVKEIRQMVRNAEMRTARLAANASVGTVDIT